MSDAIALTETIVSIVRSDADSGVIDRHKIVRAGIKVLQHFDSTAATIYKAYHPVKE